MSQLFNVYSVNMQTGERKVIAENKTKDNADAISNFAVMRNVVDEVYFVVEPTVAK